MKDDAYLFWCLILGTVEAGFWSDDVVFGWGNRNTGSRTKSWIAWTYSFTGSIVDPCFLIRFELVLRGKCFVHGLVLSIFIASSLQWFDMLNISRQSFFLGQLLVVIIQIEYGSWPVVNKLFKLFFIGFCLFRMLEEKHYRFANSAWFQVISIYFTKLE